MLIRALLFIFTSTGSPIIFFCIKEVWYIPTNSNITNPKKKKKLKQNKSFAQDLDFFYIQWKWFFITMVSALAFHSIDSKCLLFINKSSWAWWIMDSRTLHYVMLVGATGRVCMEAFVQEWSVSQKQFTFLIYWILLLRKTYCTMVYIVTQSHISQLLFNFWIIFLNKSNHKFIQVKELDLACLCSLQFFPLQVMLKL